MNENLRSNFQESMDFQCWWPHWKLAGMTVQQAHEGNSQDTWDVRSFCFLVASSEQNHQAIKTTRFVKSEKSTGNGMMTRFDKTLLKIEEFTKAFINIAVDLPVDWDSVLLFRDVIHLQQQLRSQLFHAAHWWGWTMPSQRFDEAGWTHCRGCCQHCVTRQAVCGA